MQNANCRGALILLLLPFLFACNTHHSATPEKVSPVPNSSQADLPKTVGEYILNDTALSSLAEAFHTTSLLETLDKPGPFILFAPDNNAFAKLPEGNFEAWLSKRRDDLVNILSYHIVAGSISTTDPRSVQKLRTLAGENLIVTTRRDKLIVNGNKAIGTKIDARNGTIYIIDGILFPKNKNPGAY